jgi:hypothetical protein
MNAAKDDNEKLNGRWPAKDQMNTRGFGQSSWPRYCLLAVILFGCVVLLNRADNSETVAPNLVFNR